MIRISASMLRDFNVCPMRAFYRYAKLERIPSASMIVGTLIHDLIDEYEKSGKVDIDMYHIDLAKKLSCGGVVFNRWQTGDTLWNLMNTCFNNYLSISETLPPVTSTEEFFKVEYKDTNVVGKFDQLRNKHTIVELKTSHWPPKDDFLAADIQASVYIWAYKQIFNVTPVYYYLHLPTGSLYELYRHSFDDLLLNMDALICADDHNNFLKMRDGYKCSMCDCRNACLTDDEGSSLVAKTSVKKSTKKKADFF